MRREERMIVHGPVKEQQPDGVSHTGPGGWGGGLPRHFGPPPPRCRGSAGGASTCRRGGGSVSSPATVLCPPGGGAREGPGVKHKGGGRALAASPAGLPSYRTPGSGRFEHDLHPAAPPPRRHELADREPRPSVGVALRAGVLRGRLRCSRGWQHHVPHVIHPRGGGQHLGC